MDTQETRDMPALAPRKKRHWVRWTLLAVVLFIALAAGIGSLSKPAAKEASPLPSVSTSHATAPKGQAAVPAATAPAAVPSPNGTFQGECDYTLGNDPVNGTAVATGDIEVVNTGNIGTVDKLTITWPQEGFSPLSAHKTVRVAAGASTDVQFNRPLSYDELTNLQNYQENHSDTGCTYNGAMTDTFGKAR